MLQLLSVLWSFLLHKLLGLKRVPGVRDGVQDSRQQVGSSGRLRQIPAVYQIWRSKLLLRRGRRRVRACLKLDGHKARAAALLERRLSLGEPTQSFCSVVLCFGGVMIGLAADTIVLCPITIDLGVMAPILRWVVATAVVLCSSLVFKIAIAPVHRPGSILRRASARWCLAVLVLVFDAGSSWFRYRHLMLVEARQFGEAYRQVVSGNAVGIFGVIFLISILLTAATSWGLEYQEHYWAAWKLGRKLDREERRIAKVEEELQTIAVEMECDRELVAANQEVSIAEYERGLAVGRVVGVQTRWSTGLLDGLKPLEAVLWALNIGSQALLAGLCVTKLARGFVGLLALPVGLIFFVGLFSFLLLRALPGLKLEHTAKGFESGVLRKELVQGVLFMVVVLVLVLTSCSDQQAARRATTTLAGKAKETTELLTAWSAESKRETGAVVALFDVSKSVELTDPQIAKAAMFIVTSVPRCDSVSILPVNATAGEALTVEIPCAPQPLGFEDDLNAVYRDTEAKLKEALSEWRKGEGFSDYQGALRFASERLQGHKKRALIVLGDLIDDQTPALHHHSPRPPLVPNFGRSSFDGTHVYLGLVPSREIVNLSGSDQELFEMNWQATLKTRGAVGVTLRAFGLQSLEAWVRDHVGPGKAAYTDTSMYHGRESRR